MELSARIIDFKRLAVHDGPGLRTTLFVQGCPLNCLWCHNPESIHSRPQLALLRHKCVHCGRCAQVCACHQVTRESHGIDRDTCRNCGRCVAVCPAEALTLYGRRITVTEAEIKLLEDQVFYKQSDGGVTLSGGEPLLQADFCAALLQRLKKYNIHCAIDTCGAVPFTAIEKVLPSTDLFLYDLKHSDPVLHRKYTGSDNTLILDNLEKLDRTGTPIEIRIPVVPGINDTDAVMRAMVEFLRPLRHVTGIKLLPYHPFARDKYAALDLSYPLQHALPPSSERLNYLKEFFALEHLIAEDAK